MIEAHPSKLPLLGPEAFVYYLPAYLLYSIEHFQYHHPVTEMTIYAVSPSEDYTPEEGLGEHLCERLKPFTDDQINAVEEFLLLAESDESFRRYYGDNGPARRRLRALWEARWSA